MESILLVVLIVVVCLDIVLNAKVLRQITTKTMEENDV